MKIQILFGFLLIGCNVGLFGQQTLIQSSNKLTLDVHAGVLHSVGKDIIREYHSSIQPLTIQYFSRKKFERPYFSLLANLNYELLPRVLVGVQSGIYLHVSEPYFGYKKSTVSFPVLATVRISIIDFKTDQIGIYLAAGKNFFHIEVGDEVFKNGVLLNGSLFYVIKGKSIIKFGVEKGIDEGYSYFTPRNPWNQKETFRYNLNRLSLALSYGIIIKNYF